MTEFVRNVVDTFHARKWHATSGVQNIARLLEVHDVPLSVQEISAQLETHDRGVDSTTVYRILARMGEAELVHNLHGKFVRCSDPGNKIEHHFLLCKKCSKAQEIFLDYKDSISSQLAKEKGFLLQEVDLSFLGVCKDCSHHSKK